MWDAMDKDVRKQNRFRLRATASKAFRMFSVGLFLLVLFSGASVPAQAAVFPNAAQAVPLVYAGLDEDDGYRYTQSGTGIGFSSVFKEDTTDTEYIALFEFDNGVYCELWRNGDQIPYKDGDIVVGEGDYQLLIAPSESQRASYFSLFTFRLEEVSVNDYAPEVTVSYVRAYEMFGFSGDGEPLFLLSVPNGGISQEPVVFSPVGANVAIETLYYNGKRQSYGQELEFAEPGCYLLKVNIGIPYSYWVAFRVLSCADCAVTFLPFSEELTCLSASGARLAGNTLYLPDDGAYRFRFSCPAASGVDMTWDEAVTRDTMLPGVTFSERVGSGRVHNQMHVTALSPDAELTVYWNDLPQAYFDGSFTGDGRYRVVVSDRAGNAQELSFFLYQTNRLLLTGGGAIAALAILLLLSKLKLEHRIDE